jgi:hypothetical protein
VINDRSPAEGGTFFCNLAGRGVSTKQYRQSHWNLLTWQHTRLFQKQEPRLCISWGTTLEYRLQNSCPERHTPPKGKQRCSHEKATNVSFITFQVAFTNSICIWYSVVKLRAFNANTLHKSTIFRKTVNVLQSLCVSWGSVGAHRLHEGQWPAWHPGQLNREKRAPLTN